MLLCPKARNLSQDYSRYITFSLQTPTTCLGHNQALTWDFWAIFLLDSLFLWSRKLCSSEVPMNLILSFIPSFLCCSSSSDLLIKTTVHSSVALLCFSLVSPRFPSEYHPWNLNCRCFPCYVISISFNAESLFLGGFLEFILLLYFFGGFWDFSPPFHLWQFFHGIFILLPCSSLATLLCMAAHAHPNAMQDYLPDMDIQHSGSHRWCGSSLYMFISLIIIFEFTSIIPILSPYLCSSLMLWQVTTQCDPLLSLFR